MKQTLKIQTLISALAVIVLISTPLLAQITPQVDPRYLITPNSVGEVRLGMTIGEARRELGEVSINNSECFEEGYRIEVKTGQYRQMYITAPSIDLNGDVVEPDCGEKAPPIDENAQITYIEVYGHTYKTLRGVHPLMEMKDVESTYGKVKQIISDPHSGEYATFVNQPEGFEFKVDNENVGVGDYEELADGTAVSYKSHSYIESISISSYDDEEEATEETTPPLISGNLLITENSVGDIRLGMTVAQAKAAMKDFDLVRSQDGEGIALIDVKSGKYVLMTLYAGEEDTATAPDPNAMIQNIDVWHPAYTTAAGVHPNQTVNFAAAKYGGVKTMFTTEIESREYVEFKNQPKTLSFRVSARWRDFGGIYSNGRRETNNFVNSARIYGISVVE